MKEVICPECGEVANYVIAGRTESLWRCKCGWYLRQDNRGGMMTRTSSDQYINGRLINGYDYHNHAWVQQGVYIRCGHPNEMNCNCYGKLHEGESTTDGTERYYRYNIGYGYYVNSVDLAVYKVVKHTPSGVWISQGVYGRHFILNNSRKKFAYPDKATALESFKLRKERQIKILTGNLSTAKEALILAENISVMLSTS